MTERPIVDQAQREHARDPRHSFIVQAAAGSGKTQLLVQRFLALLQVVEKPEEIIAITFTRKAAAEMRKRILAGLASVQLRWPAEEVAQRLRVETIDALCMALTRQLPVLARLGAQPESIDDADVLYHEASRRTLALLESDDAAAAKVGRLLEHLDGDSAAAERLLADMLGRRDQWLRNTGQPRSREELEAAFIAQCARLVDEAQRLHPDAPTVGDTHDDWRQHAIAMLTLKGTWRVRGVPAELKSNEALRAALHAIINMPPAGYSDAQWSVLEAILGLLPLAAAQLKLVFAERGQTDFTEISQGAVRALGAADAPTDLLLAFDARVHHLLIDEFQDTSISQWELLERLTAGWESDDGRTLFAVGDPMQSIYRFREAEVALFGKARRQGMSTVELKPLTLSTNFRSQAGLVEWVNRAFTDILPASSDTNSDIDDARHAESARVSYAASTPHHPGEPGLAAVWHGFFFTDDKAQARIAEARRVSEIVIERRAQSAHSKIAILIRSRGALEYIVPALKQANVRFRAIDIEPLGAKQIVQDLHALTRAMTHLGDRIAWLALLRAPWCGLDLRDLAVLAENASEQLIWELMHDDARIAALSTNGRARLMRVRTILAAALARRLRLGLRSQVEGVWLALGGPACAANAAELENAEAYLDHLEDAEEAGDLTDPAAFEQSLDKLFAPPDMTAGDDAVEIMTIHKAKGLEFDVVIVPGLDRIPGSGDAPLLAWKELSDTALLMAPIKQAGAKSEPMYDYVRQIEKVADDAETDLLLYVAVTRAKSQLHLLACARARFDDNVWTIAAPQKRSLLAHAWPAAEADMQQQLAQWSPPDPMSSAPEIATPNDHGTQLRRLPENWIAPQAPVAALWQEIENENDNGIEFSWAGETARRVGNVVHRWLQRIAEEQLRGWDAQRVETLRQTLQLALIQAGVHKAELPSALDNVIAALKGAVSDTRGRWLLGEHHDAYNERRLTAFVDGKRRHFIMDRMFRDAEGVQWIVDYKTSSHEGSDTEGFLDREQERYRRQLLGYAALLAQPDTMLGLYFPLLAGWREMQYRN